MFPIPLSANCNPPPRSGGGRLTALWTSFTLLITTRHARRFVYAAFLRNGSTDHNYSANNNRPNVPRARDPAATSVCRCRIYGSAIVSGVNKIATTIVPGNRKKLTRAERTLAGPFSAKVDCGIEVTRKGSRCSLTL